MLRMLEVRRGVGHRGVAEQGLQHAEQTDQRIEAVIAGR